MKKRSDERFFIRGKIIRNNQINDCRFAISAKRLSIA